MNRLFSLDEAVLSGGARIATAGGGLPRRVTLQADTYVDDANYFWCGPIFDPDNLHVWTGDMDSSVIKKIRISDGVVVSTLAAPGVMGLFRYDATLFYAALYSAPSKLREYDFSGTLLKNLDVSAVRTNLGQVVRVPGTTNKAWLKRLTDGGTDAAREVDLTTGAATGRTIAGPIYSMFATTGYIWVNRSENTIQKIQESDLAVVATWAHGGNQYSGGGPGYLSDPWKSIYVDATGRVWLNCYDGSLDRFDAAGGTPPAGGKRILYHSPTQRGGVKILASEYHSNGFVAFSDDGNYVAFPTINTARTLLTSLRIRRISLHRARWTIPFVGAATLKSIAVPGLLGNQYDGSTFDYRRTRCYYAVAGGARVEFTPGTPLTVSIAVGQSLQVDADMNTWETPVGPDPYVGGDAGEGISVLYEDRTL